MMEQKVEFLKFNSNDEASLWGKFMYNPWINSLSKEELSALKIYTGEVFYSNINDTLRGFSNFTYNNEKYCDLITSALSKARTPANLVVFRGTSKMMLGQLKNLPADQLVGKVMEDKAFMSTSLLEGEVYDSNLILVMNVPKGTQGAYIGNLSFLHGEFEFLLNRGYRMVINKVISKNPGYLKLEVDILDNYIDRNCQNSI
jgi:hypothetical protein